MGSRSVVILKQVIHSEKQRSLSVVTSGFLLHIRQGKTVDIDFLRLEAFGGNSNEYRWSFGSIKEFSFHTIGINCVEGCGWSDCDTMTVNHK